MSESFRGLAIECSGPVLSVGIFDAAGDLLAARERASEQAHARHLLPAIDELLHSVHLAPRELGGVAIDVGPGSFTALRVGLATARGLAHPHRTPVVGVTSFAALLEGRSFPRQLVVPLLLAGRTQLYAGFYRGDPRGATTLLRGPAAGTVDVLLEAVEEALALCPRGTRPRFLGPGAARERARLEAHLAGSTAGEEGALEPAGARGPEVRAVARLGATALGRARNSSLASGPAPERLRPLYVRAPQAVERAPATRPFWAELELLPFAEPDLDDVLTIERAVFSDPWPRKFFQDEIELPQAVARVARHRGRLAGYLVAWRLDDEMHLGNLAVAPDLQRRGVGEFLLEWLVRDASVTGQRRITLEVRSSNFAAQELYRRHGFRAVALRRAYYHDTGEDALVMLRELP